MQYHPLLVKIEGVPNALVWPVIDCMEALLAELHLSACIVLLAHFVPSWHCGIVHHVTASLDLNALVRGDGQWAHANIVLRVYLAVCPDSHGSIWKMAGHFYIVLAQLNWQLSLIHKVRLFCS